MSPPQRRPIRRPDRVAVPAAIDPDVPFVPGDRPPHRQWALLVLVFVGGSVGAVLRYAITEVVPQLAGVPVAVVATNVVGAFALGLLLEVLSRRGPDVGRRRVVRLFVGTGMLGGFTTYSALAVDTDTLLAAGRVGIALAYAGSTLVGGLAAAAAGIALGARTGIPGSHLGGLQAGGRQAGGRQTGGRQTGGSRAGDSQVGGRQ